MNKCIILCPVIPTGDANGIQFHSINCDFSTWFVVHSGNPIANCEQ